MFRVQGLGFGVGSWFPNNKVKPNAAHVLSRFTGLTDVVEPYSP